MIEPYGVGIHASQEALDDAKLDHPPDIDRLRVERERFDPLGERVTRSQLRVVREQGRKGHEGRIPCHLNVAPVCQFVETKNALYRRATTGLTLARKDIVLAFGRQVGRAPVFLLGILYGVGDIGQERVRVGELKNVGRDDGVVVPSPDRIARVRVSPNW